MKRGSTRRGQTATEYMLVLSVIVTSLVAAGYLFVPSFQQGVASLGVDVSSLLSTGDMNGVGFDRSHGFSGAAASGGASANSGAPVMGDAGGGLGSPFPSSQNSTDSGGGNGGGLRGQPGTPGAPIPKVLAPKDNGGQVINLDTHDS